MTDYTKTIVNATTGEVSVEPLTDIEILELVARKNASELEDLENAAKEEFNRTSRKNAIEKLKLLGLTEEEIKSLVG